MNELDSNKPISDEEKEKNLHRIGEDIQRAKILQDLEKMPKPSSDSERPTADDPPVWEQQPDGTMKKAA